MQGKNTAEKDQIWKATEECFGSASETLVSVELFVKQEVLPGTWSVARAIQATNDAIKGLTLPIYKLLEHQVYQNEHFVKRINPVDWVKHMKDKLLGYTYYSETDYEKFDASQSAPLLIIEQMLIDRICPQFSEWWQFVHQNDIYIVSKDRKISALDHKSWKSGEPLTSLANTLINLLVIEFAWWKY